MQNTFRFTLCLVAISIFLFACNKHSDNNKTKSIEVTDYTNTLVRLDKPAKRIVTLAPHIVENLFTAGAGDLIIGVVDYSNFPEEALSITNIGSAFNINQESIIALKPDLIIAWETGNSHTVYNKLKDLGYPVYVDEPKTLNDIAKSIRDFGVLTGRIEPANSAANTYLYKLEKLQSQYKDVAPVTSFYQIWNEPLQTINGMHIISDVMQICGGENIYANEIAIAPIINIESILDRDPQAIIASGTSPNRPLWLDDWKQWDSLTAVKNDSLFFVEPDHLQRHTVRLLQGIESLCSQLDTARTHF